MYQVGTNAGRAWQFREGEGESAVITTPLYDTYLTQVAILNDQERRAKKAKEEDDYQKRIDKINERMGDSDFSTDASVRQNMMQFLDKTAEYKQRTGKNPFSATNNDSGAQQLQKEYWRYYAMPQDAKRINEHFKAQQAMLLASPEKFEDDDNLAAIEEGIQGEKLVEYVTGKKPLPSLKVTAPTADILAELSNTMKSAGIQDNDVEAFGQNGLALVQSMFAGPKAKAISTSALQILEKSPDDVKQDIVNTSNIMGIPLEQAMVLKMGADVVQGGLTPEKILMEAYEKFKDVGETITADGRRVPNADKGIKGMIEYMKGLGGYKWDMVLGQYGNEKKIRDVAKQFDWGNTGLVWKPTGGTGDGTGGDIFGRTQYAEWRQLARSGDQRAAGMLQGSKTVVSTGRPDQPTVEGKINGVKFLGEVPASRFGYPNLNQPVERWQLSVSVPDPDNEGQMKDVLVDIDGAELDRIAITPVTNYVKSKAGAGEVNVPNPGVFNNLGIE